MRPTADPSELRRLAHECRHQAGILDSAVSTLNSRIRSVRSDWTGTAAETLENSLRTQMDRTRDVMSWLRSAADELERGASDVQAYREAEERREREERERREREDRERKNKKR